MTVLFVSTRASSKEPDAPVVTRVTSSPEITPDKEGVPVYVAIEDPSYSLFAAVIPVTVKAAGVILAVSLSEILPIGVVDGGHEHDAFAVAVLILSELDKIIDKTADEIAFAEL